MRLDKLRMQEKYQLCYLFNESEIHCCCSGDLPGPGLHCQSNFFANLHAFRNIACSHHGGKSISKWRPFPPEISETSVKTSEITLYGLQRLPSGLGDCVSQITLASKEKKKRREAGVVLPLPGHQREGQPRRANASTLGVAAKIRCHL